MGDEQKEELLNAWLQMSLCVRGNRLLKNLSLNEVAVCNYLYRNRDSGKEITATHICEEFRIFKSQMNKVISSLEEKGVIERYQGLDDKRKLCIRLKEDKLSIYLDEHEHVLQIMDAVEKSLGKENTAQLANLMKMATAAVNELQGETKL
ncbi:MAG: MarR family transcriptional regulator [Coriobacteriales bacterium]|nr:MarR family transcriptional regulator [Coriobacteriales bacterium]